MKLYFYFTFTQSHHISICSHITLHTSVPSAGQHITLQEPHILMSVIFIAYNSRRPMGQNDAFVGVRCLSIVYKQCFCNLSTHNFPMYHQYPQIPSGKRKLLAIGMYTSVDSNISPGPLQTHYASEASHEGLQHDVEL